MKKYVVCIGLFLIIAFFFWTVTKKRPPIANTYKGIAISPETLSELLPLPSATDRLALENQLRTPEIQKILDRLLPFTEFPDWQSKSAADNLLLKHMNLPNLSKSNYVFKLPEQDFIIKIAGPANRLQSVLMAHGFWPGERPTKPITKVTTYQTASRAAYYLILKELIEKKKFKHISTPETYLFFYPNQTGTIDDEHVFIAQKSLPDSAEKLTSELAQTLSDDVITEIVEAIIACGLWSINDNLFFDRKSDTVYFVDLEQPNNSAPQDFFHKDTIRYYGNLRAGLEEFIDLFAGNREKLSFIRSIIESNPVFNSRQFYPRYKAELTNILHTKAPLATPPPHACSIN